MATDDEMQADGATLGPLRWQLRQLQQLQLPAGSVSAFVLIG